MAELYNLGIGLTVVDRASKPVRSVDAALMSMTKTTFEAVRGMAAFDKILTGASVDDSLGAVSTALERAIQLQQKYNEKMGESEKTTVGAEFAQLKLKDSFEAGAAVLGLVPGLMNDWLVSVKETTPGISFLSEQLGKLAGKVKSAVRSLEDLEFLGEARELVLDFEDSTQKMAVGLGQGTAQAFALRSEMLSLVGTTQFSLGEVTRLTTGLTEAGVSLTDVSQQEQEAFIALNDIWGVSGQEIAKTDKMLGIFGGSLKSSLDDATAFQTQFRIPGLMQELPGIVEGAGDALVEFGASVVGSGAQVVRSVTRTAGVFAKTFGKTMADAVNAAQASFSRFASAARTHADVFLGLSGSFDPLTMAMMEAGIGLERSSGMIDRAKDAPLRFATEMREHIDRMPNEFMRKRFMRQLQQELPRDLALLVSDTEAYNKARDAQTEADARGALAQAAGAKKFEDLTKGMLNTTKELRKMWFNVKQLGMAFLTQTGLTDVMKGALGEAKDVFAGLSLKIQEVIESRRFQEWGKVVVPVFKTVGKWTLILGTALGGLLSGAAAIAGTLAGFKVAGAVIGKLVPKTGKLGFGFTKLFDLFKSGKKLLLGFGGGLKKLLFGPIGFLIAGVSGVATAVKDMGDVMGDPSRTGMEKFQALLRGLFKGVGGAINTLLLGIPGKIADHFFPDMESRFDKGFAGLFKTIGALNITGWIGDKLGAAADVIGKWFKGIGPFLSARAGPAARELFTSLGRTLGGLTSWLFGTVVPGLLKGAAGALKFVFFDFWVDMFSVAGSKEANDSFKDALGSIWQTMKSMFSGAADVLWSALEGVLDGVFRSWGSSLKEVRASFAVGFTAITNKILNTTDSWGIAIQKGTRDGLVNPVLDGISGIAKSFLWLGTRVLVLTEIFKRGGKGMGAALKVGLLEAIDAVSVALLGFANKFIGGLKSMLAGVPFADMTKEIAALDAQQKKLGKSAKQFSGQIASAKADLIAGADLGGIFKTADDKYKDLAGSVDKFTAATRGSMNAQIEADEAGLASDKLIRAAALEKLKRKAQTASEETRVEGERFTAATKFRREEETNLAESLKTMMAVADQRGKLNAAQGRHVEKSLRESMDASISSIATSIKKGQLTFAQGQTQFEAAKTKAITAAIKGAQAIKEAREGKKPAAVAAGAADVRGALAGVTPAMWGQLIDRMDTALGKRESIKATFTLRGNSAATNDITRRMREDP